MRPIAFMARCQRVTVREQYELGVRCFDLRVRFDAYGNAIVSHGVVEYRIATVDIHADLAWLDGQGDCYVRVLHEVRSESQYDGGRRSMFRYFCSRLEHEYGNTRFWCGRNLCNWEKDYDFGICPSCCERYSSVCPPRIIDDWWPWLYARLHNRRTMEQGTDKDILLIDYVDI